MAYQYRLPDGTTLDELLNGPSSSASTMIGGIPGEPSSFSPYAVARRAVEWDAPDTSAVDKINQAPVRPALRTAEGAMANDLGNMSDADLIAAVNSTPPTEQAKIQALISELQTRQRAYTPPPPPVASQEEPPTSSSTNLMPGWEMAKPPENNGSTYKINGKEVSYEEYLRAWEANQRQANPENRPLIVDPDTRQWRPVTDAEIAQARKLGYDTGTPTSPSGSGVGSGGASGTDPSYLDWGIEQKQINAALNKARFFGGGETSDGTPITSVNDAYGGVDSSLNNFITQRNTSARTIADAINNELSLRQGNYDNYSAQKSSTDAARAAALSAFQGAGATAKSSLSGALSAFEGGAGAAKSGYQANLGAYLGETNGLMAMHQGAGWGADVTMDPALRAAQQQAMDALVQEAVAGGATQQEAINFARNQIQTGGKLQQQVFDKQWGLTDPTNTAAERAVYDQNMRAMEDRNRGVRDAALDQLARRGLKSGDAMLAAQEGARASTDSVAAQTLLGMQGQAVERSQQALRDSGVTADAMRGKDQSAIQVFGNVATQKRSADQAAQMNRYGAASDMTSQDNDLKMFNKTGSQAAARWQDQVAMSESARVGNLAAQRNDARNSTTSNIFGVDNALFGARNTTANSIFGVDSGLFDASRATTNDQAAADRDFYGLSNDFYTGNTSRIKSREDELTGASADEVKAREAILGNSKSWLGDVGALDDIDPILALLREKNNADKIDDQIEELDP